MKDIFISYRRTDGEAIAYLIYKDLIHDGYSVFFDHKSLGGGNFKQNIADSIRECQDVIVILSGSSFSEKIDREEDIYRLEIEEALKQKKRIVGIMLESFPCFPDRMPESILPLRHVNCLRLFSGYYDAMFDRLTSGHFLTSSSKHRSEAVDSDIAINASIPAELRPLASLPADQKTESIRLLLDIMDKFNQSDACIRFYRFIDIYDRKRGKEIIPPYDGVVPTDLATYLSFFETLYIIIASKALELSVIDYAYRYRFFAGCNNPVMQDSELLPLGYQYPNILSFYNLWCSYIADQYDHTQKCRSIAEIIPMYDYDLHKRYAAYCFADNPGSSIEIRFLDRHLNWLKLCLKTIAEDELPVCMALQDAVLGGISENDEKNVFEALTEEEMRSALKRNACVGLYDGDRLAAQVNLLLSPQKSENLAMDLDSELYPPEAAVLDYVVVSDDYRGFGIQKTLLFVAECFAALNDRPGVIAVTSPLNIHSIKNFIAQGYSIVATQKKYRSIRHYLWKSLP